MRGQCSDDYCNTLVPLSESETMDVRNGHQATAPPEAPPVGPHPTDPWRDAKGRYLPGNPGGPGNPHVREMARLKARLREQTPDGAFDLLRQRWYDLAFAGNFPA